MNAEGKPSFQMLQNRRSLGREWQILYYAFDLLNLEGNELRGQPLRERKAKLHGIVSGSPIRYSAELEGAPGAIVTAIEKAGLEGVIAKRRDSVYQAGTRSLDWLKLKLGNVQEFVIGGYKREGPSFQSLLAGYYDKRQLLFAGKVRQGFNPATRRQLIGTLQALETTKCPFVNLPASYKSHFGEGVTAEEMKKLRWVKPQLVMQVRFTEWTNYGLLRHGTYLGLRDDKSPEEVVREPGRAK